MNTTLFKAAAEYASQNRSMFEFMADFQSEDYRACREGSDCSGARQLSAVFYRAVERAEKDSE